MRCITLNEILVEKWRPSSSTDIVGVKPELVELIKSGNPPHILTFGKCGTGKTTFIKWAVKELNAKVMVLNASKERGIDVIREKIEPFAQSMSDQLKIVFLDEMDSTTPAFQTALRNFMETYSKNTRFFASCNYLNKIIEPLQSRFKIFEFGGYTLDDKFARLRFIADQENIKIDDETLKLLIVRYKDDLRAMINFLDGNKSKVITKDDFSSDDLVKDILTGLKNKQWQAVRMKLLNESVDYESLLLEIEKFVFESKDYNEDSKRKVNLFAAKYSYEMSFSLDKELCFSAFLNNIGDVV